MTFDIAIDSRAWTNIADVYVTGKKRFHLLWRFQIALGIARQQSSGSCQSSFVAKSGEGIGEFAFARSGVIYAIGCEQRQMESVRDLNCDAVAVLFVAMKMALQFDKNILATENSGESFDRAMRFLHAAELQRRCQRPVIAAGKADQSIGMFLQLIFPHCAFIFLGAQLHLCDQAAEIVVTSRRRDEKRKAVGIAD